MRAVVCEGYGGPDVLAFRPTPTPKANEILVRVRATTMSSADWRVRRAPRP
jgi:NADPH:quinone reductase-like Zn-dependent oxidoreductase